MIPKIKNLSSDKKNLLSNYISLTVLQAANFILPLLTLPYLVRVLGAEEFGLVMFAQAFMIYFNLLVDFGFSLSASREIALHRGNEKKISEIFSTVMFIKLVLILFSFAIMSIIVFSFEKFSHDWLLYFYSFGVVIGQALFPIWFFQGMEKMKYITFLNILAKTIFTIAIFIFIQSKADFLYVPLINSLGFLSAGFISLFIIFRTFKVDFIVPSYQTMVHYFKDSSQFFLSRVAISIYTTSNTFILGLVTNNTIVGYYAAAEKLYVALRQVYTPIVNVLYPYITNKKDIVFFKKAFKLVNLVNMLFASIAFILAGFIINIMFGQAMEPATDIFRFFIVMTLIVVPTTMIGYPFLAALGQPQYANMSIVYGSINHFIGLGFLYMMDWINVYSILILTMLTELIVLFIRIYGIKKHKLWEGVTKNA